jgi:DNA-binding CsgD family transcriptional regulator
LCPVLVGRDAELTALRTAAEAARAARGSVVLLMGEAGIGKTRLLRELRSWCAEREMLVLGGRAVETATATPFRPLAEALLAADRTTQIRDDPQVAPFRGSLATLLPAWSTDASAPGAGVPLLHVAEGVLRVARGCAAEAAGAVLLLDDLHWADAETIEVIDYLADQILSEPVLVVASARPDPDSASVRALRRLLDRRSATLVSLSRLEPELTTEMVRHCLADTAVPAQLSQLLQDNADGLPFFVEELLTGLATDRVLVRRGGGWVMRRPARMRAPTTFAESVRTRFARLAPDGAEVLLDAALLGRRVDPPLLAQVADSAPDAVGEVLDAAADLGLLEITEEGVRFRHSLTRDALLAALPASARAARARRVLAVVRSARPVLADELGIPAEAAAELAEAGGEPAEAARLLLAVAQHAIEHGALVSAESAQRRALALAEATVLELDAREALVATLGLAGRPDEAFGEGELVLARLAEPGLDPEGSRRRATHLAMARAALAASDWPLAQAHLDQLGAPDPAGDPTAHARLAALRAVVALGRYRLDDADRLANEAAEAAGRAGAADLRCEALLVQGRCARMRDLAAAEAAFEQARAVAHAAGLTHLEARAVTELGFVVSYRAGADELLHEARRLAEACGAPETEAVVRIALSAAAWYRADIDAQMTHGQAAIRLARRYRLGQLVPAAMIMLAGAHAQRADLNAMTAMLAQVEPLIGDEPNEVIAIGTQCRATYALVRDDLEKAFAELAAAAELGRNLSLTSPPPMLGMAALTLALHGQDPTELISDFRARNYHIIPQVAALLQAAEAVHTGQTGHLSTATEHMGNALRDLTPNAFLRAIVARLVAPHAATDGWGEPSSWLTEALELFEARGLQAAAQACRVALRELGQRVRYGSEELTARELDVLDLLAEGLSNRQVGARLFISARTVEKHVERLLVKTSCANRSQLATYALRAQSASAGAHTAGPGT